MMDAETMARAAEIYASAKIDRIPIDSIDEKYIPREEADGYAIQNKLLEICEARGPGPVKGYKVGLVNAEMRAKWAKDLRVRYALLRRYSAKVCAHRLC